MSLICDQAIVLRRIDYSETSQILELLAREHGKLGVIAKGAKRSTKTRFGTAIDLLERGDVTATRRAGGDAELATLTEWKQRELHAGLRSDLRRLYAGQYLAEVTGALVESEDPHPRLFDGVASALSRISGGEPVLLEVVRCQMTLLAEVGLWPDLTGCTACGKPLASGATYFSSGSGGLVCRDCEPSTIEKRSVSSRTLAWLGQLGGEPAARAEDPAVAGAFDLLNYHIGYTLGREPKLAGYLVPAAQRRRL